MFYLPHKQLLVTICESAFRQKLKFNEEQILFQFQCLTLLELENLLNA